MWGAGGGWSSINTAKSYSGHGTVRLLQGVGGLIPNQQKHSYFWRCAELVGTDQFFFSLVFSAAIVPVAKLVPESHQPVLRSSC